MPQSNRSLQWPAIANRPVAVPDEDRICPLWGGQEAYPEWLEPMGTMSLTLA
ncbi:hypothetical protein [Okeania sp. SIO2G5]|uniref:hypothetical protein n=1 Tax=Okeania sp. SIO2G5 TaxID=2607796 RepID=UPI0035C8C591